MNERRIAPLRGLSNLIWLPPGNRYKPALCCEKVGCFPLISGRLQGGGGGRWSRAGCWNTVFRVWGRRSWPHRAASKRFQDE